MTAEEFRAADAKQLLENPMLRDAFEAMASYIEQKAVGCDPDNKEMAQRIILSKQLLAGIKREIERHIENATVEKMRIAQLEKRSLRSVFQR